MPSFKNILRATTILCLATILTLASLPAQAKPEGAAGISSLGEYQQVAVGTGWILFNGNLYWTNNNGAAWTDITPAGNIRAVDFLNTSRGWTVASVGNGFILASTSDGGTSWRTHALDLAALSHLDAPVAKVYMDWRTNLHGWMVFKLTTSSNFSRGLLFVTFDGGITWNERTTPLGEAVTFSDANNGWVTGGPMGNQTFRTRDGGLSWQPAPFNGGQPTNQNEAGWKKQESGECADASCRREAQLLATPDGITWTPMRLPNGQTFLRDEFLSVKSPAFSDTDTKAYQGQGFDKCEIATLTQMQAWWNHSPYSAVNLYIGGVSRGCPNSALSPSYLSQLNVQGWRFIPTWVGLQASCSAYAHRMSSDPSVAYTQGMAEADDAVAVAQSLGLTEADGSGTVIYFDLESYDTGNSTCRAAANAFIDGWTYQMQSHGNLAGVYGSSCASAPTDWWSLTNVPDALWVANWFASPGAVSFTPTATVWDMACLSNSLWPNHQRLRQYAGDHNETWGGLTLTIDSNVLDGPLTVPNGAGDAAAPNTPSNPTPAQNATLERTNDTWLYWKTNGDTCSLHVWGGSLDTTADTSCSLYHLGIQAGGAYSWQVTATNGFGSTVGPVWNFNIRPAPPSGLVSVPASSTRVNLAWTASADLVDSYLIYADGSLVGNATSNATSYQVQDLACNTAHTFYVKTVRQGIQSEASNTANATTGSCAPELVSPLDGVMVDSLQPTLTWLTVDGASYYQVQVSLYSSFARNLINARTLTTSYDVPRSLPANQFFYWRVRAIGTFGIGDWASSSFTTPNPPPAPVPVSPSRNALITDYTPLFDWRDVTAPAGSTLDHYQIQAASDPAFLSLFFDDVVTASEFISPTELQPNTRIYWRVRAVDSLGYSSAWSAVWYFRAAMLPPNPSSPVDGSPLLDRRPSFEWSTVTGATSYTLQISTTADFTQILKIATSAAPVYSLPTDLPANSILYWRVRANGANGPSLWSESWSFHTANPPSVPIPALPFNNALVNDLTPTLTWRPVTIPGGTTFDHYQIQVATDSGFVSIIVDGTVDTISPSEFTLTTTLAPAGRYYWRVRAFNTDGEYSAWSRTRIFRTSTTAVFELWMQALGGLS